MKKNFEGLSFGELILNLRTNKGWTVKEFINKLRSKGREKISPAYITRVEQYDEIPSPELICLMADALDSDVEKLLDKGMKRKIMKFNENLEEKYKKAAGMYRTQSSGKPKK